MPSKTGQREAYRLVIALDGRDAVADEHRYNRFDKAQSQVANAVVRHARYGRVTSVLLQHGRPINGDGKQQSTPHAPLLPGPGYEWVIEKRWGPEVVRRILRQRKTSLADGEPALDNQLHSRACRLVGRHKAMRWQIFGTAAALMIMIVATLLIQTGGRPNTLLPSSDTAREQSVLPFDARTDFELAEQVRSNPPLTPPHDSTPSPARRALLGSASISAVHAPQAPQAGPAAP